METRFLANMNISPKTVAASRREGWDIICVSDLLPMNATDQEILERSRLENRVVVTQNLDFSTLLALGGHHRPSVLTLRLSASDPEAITRRLKEVVFQLEQELGQGSAVTVEDVVVRVHHLPIE